MPPKRPHKKSRYGCDKCRTRRVKCDEKLPRCANCSTRGEECRYSRQPAHQINPSSADESSYSSPVDPPSTGSADVCIQHTTSASALAPSPPDLVGISDVALMHHWCTRTCHTFTSHEAELFRDHVGQEALRHDYLLEALLATTLLHMASETDNPTTASSLVSVALQHQDRSVSGLRATLGHIVPSNCDSIFACSVLVMVCSIVSPLLSNVCETGARFTAEAIMLLADFIKGTASVVDLSRPWLEQGPLHKMFKSKCKHFFAATSKWFPAEELRHLRDTAISYDDQTHQVFDDAMQELERAFNGEQSTIKWVVRVNPRLIDELKGGNSLAIIIFMLWGVLLHGLDNTWWTQFSGRKLVENLSVSLGGHGGESGKLAIWCRGQVGLPP